MVPIHRHDIYRLATALDDVLDYQHGVADLMELLPIDEAFPWFRKQVETLAADVRSDGGCGRAPPADPEGALGCLRDQAGRSARGTGSTVARSPTLYSGDYRALEVLMWKDLLAQVEAAIDRCEDVANQIESVVAKFA